MAEAEGSGYRLEHLREKWESDPTSRVFVQLADEYRQRGEPEKALKVLKEGLEHHPSYLSAQVALARCSLETSRPGDALEILQRVLERDPSHLVAGKLVVKAHLARGDRGGAAEALDRYRVLGGPEEEVEALAEMIRRARASGPKPETEPGAEPEKDVVPSPGSVSETPDEASDPSSPSEGAVFQLPSPPQGGPEWPAPPPGGARILRGGEGAPIPLEGADRESRYLEGLAEGDVLPFRRPEPRAEAEPGPPPEEPALRPEPELPEAPEPAPEKVSETGREAPAETEAAAPPTDTAMAEPPTEDVGPPAEPTEPPPEPPQMPEGEPDSERAATATLGDLYLRQGYLDEAESIYREVLRREPDHEEARRGIETVRSRRRRWLSAEEILEDVGTELKGVTARKTELLRRYMTRLKEGAERDVSGETA